MDLATQILWMMREVFDCLKTWPLSPNPRATSYKTSRTSSVCHRTDTLSRDNSTIIDMWKKDQP